MGSRKPSGKKIKLIAARGQSAPRWADIRTFGMKRARGRRIRVRVHRRGRMKV